MSHPTHSLCNVVLTFLYQQMGSMFPSLPSRVTVAPASTNNVQRWRCMTSETGPKMAIWLPPGPPLGHGLWEPRANKQEVQRPWRPALGDHMESLLTKREAQGALADPSPSCSGRPDWAPGMWVKNPLRRSHPQLSSECNLMRGQKAKNAWKSCSQITNTQKLWENDYYCFKLNFGVICSPVTGIALNL